MIENTNDLIGTEQELDNLLEEILVAAKEKKVPNFNLSLEESLRSPERKLQGEALLHIHELSTGLAEILVRDPRLFGNQARMIQSGYGGWVGFYPNFVNEKLLLRLFKTGNVQATIEWLRKILTTTRASAKLVLAVWGVKVDGEIQVTENIKVMPIHLLPDCDQKQALLNHPAGNWGVASISVFDMAKIEAAVVMDVEIAQVVATVGEDGEAPKVDRSSDFARLREIAQFFLLVGARISIPGMAWLAYDDADLNVLSGSTYHLTEVAPVHIPRQSELDAEELRQLVTSYLALSGDDQQKIKIALFRIDQASRRREVGDRAVELSTALECLVGDDAKTEMTHKVKVRAVRLIGGTESQRKKNATIISKSYSIRSSLVHSGKVDLRKKHKVLSEDLTAAEVVEEGLLLSIELVKKILSLGNIPEWDIFDITDFPQSVSTESTTANA
ncbi:HEPN domain-containing protein [Herbaspirillum aquaticum]|uniref:HEPN domain-containing protein n=1 Tax=Herbaspirillum aquaticum TaxID=568783 RepID=UPI0024DE4080|nr:HEPN domain-containing protein [Herbaspirillum aquaticum]